MLVRHAPIRDARPSALRPMRWSWQERFDKIPQRIWKQRGGHTCSRYAADVGQVLEVLLHAVSKKGRLPEGSRPVFANDVSLIYQLMRTPKRITRGARTELIWLAVVAFC
jgi:hypothetical protein